MHAAPKQPCPVWKHGRAKRGHGVGAAAEGCGGAKSYGGLKPWPPAEPAACAGPAGACSRRAARHAFYSSVCTVPVTLWAAGGCGGDALAFAALAKEQALGFAGESKKAFTVSSGRSGWYSTPKMQHAAGRTPFTGGMASDAKDRVFNAS